MIYHLIYLNEHGEITRIEIPRGDNNPSESDTLRYYREAHIGDPQGFIENLVWNGTAFVQRPIRPNQYATWNGAWGWNSDRILADIRAERNNRLYVCDWTQLADAPITSAQNNPDKEKVE